MRSQVTRHNFPCLHRQHLSNISATSQRSRVATEVRGCGPRRAALARGGKGAKNAENLKKNSRENSDCKFHMCMRARKTKRYGQRVPIVSYYVRSLAASVRY